MDPLYDELVALIDASLSIASLSEEDQQAVKERLLALPEAEMQQAVQVLRREQRQQYESMKGLVDKIEEASRDLKKSFLKEREKAENAESDQKASELMQKLDDIE